MVIKKVLLLLVTGIMSCSPATDITGSWKNTAATPKSVRKVLVITLNGSKEAREIIEKHLSITLRQRGYLAIEGMEILPAGIALADGPAKEDILEKIQGSGTDAILTIALLNEHTEDRFVPGSDRYDPVPRFGYQPRFWGYYSDLYPVLNTPGYYQEDKVYFMETNLYDAETEALLWSAQSHTYSPDALSPVAKDFSAVLVAKLEKDGVITRE